MTKHPYATCPNCGALYWNDNLDGDFCIHCGVKVIIAKENNDFTSLERKKRILILSVIIGIATYLLLIFIAITVPNSFELSMFGFIVMTIYLIPVFAQLHDLYFDEDKINKK